jgi:hypothetical protein
MTATEVAEVIGRKGLATLRLDASPPVFLTIPVSVKDARRNFGRTDLLISPLGGSGEVWVHSERVQLEDGKRGCRTP